MNDSGSFSWFVPGLISTGNYNIIIADAAGDNSKSELFTIVSAVTGNTASQFMGKTSSSQSAQITPTSTISYSTSTVFGGQSNTTPKASNSPSVTVVTGGNSNVGSIVGGVAGGVGVLALMIGGMYLINRHAKKHILAGSDHLHIQGAGTTNVETTLTKAEVQHATSDSRV